MSLARQTRRPLTVLSAIDRKQHGDDGRQVGLAERLIRLLAYLFPIQPYFTSLTMARHGPSSADPGNGDR